MKTLLLFTTIIISVWLCAGTERFLYGTHNLLRQRRSISESTRSHNEYDRSDRRAHHTTNNNLDATPGNCVPGTRWKSDCNSCWCSEGGVAACTLMACLHFGNNNNALTNSHHRQPIFGHAISRNSISEQGDKHIRVRRSENTSEKCIPGTRWKQDCNNCWCTETGIGACTLMGCIHFDNNKTVPLTNNRQRRSASDTTTSSSNTIRSSSDTTRSSSDTTTTTRHRNASPSSARCKQGTTWMNSCNRCRCIRGGHAACTRMMCLEKETII